jgi:hypothetical protein
MEVVNLFILGWSHRNYFERTTCDDCACLFEQFLGNAKGLEKIDTFFYERFKSASVHSSEVILRQTHLTKYPFLFLGRFHLRPFQ